MRSRSNWTEENRRGLEESLGSAPPGALAVFDWDNTCIHGDIGDAVFRHLLLSGGLRLDPERLAARLPETLEGERRIGSGPGKMALAGMKDRIVDAYKRLYYGGYRRTTEFAVPLLALMSALEAHSGAGCSLAYSCMAALMEGFSPRQLRLLTLEVVEKQIAAPLRRRRSATADRAFRFDWREGLRPYPEMRELMAAMRRRGFSVLISSATHPGVVKAMARACGYPFDQLIGMETGPGRIPPNWGPGKVANLRARGGAEPWFAAGDSPGDIPLLTEFAGTRLRLVIDRRQPGKMARFIGRVRGAAGFLVQPVSRRGGRFAAGCRPGA